MLDIHYKNSHEHIDFAKKIRKEPSKAEKALWNALRQLKTETHLKFRQQHPLYPYVADFACVKARLIIELDGDSHDTGSAQAYDKERTLVLNKKNWTVLRFANEEVLQNLDGVVVAIVDKAQELLGA